MLTPRRRRNRKATAGGASINRFGGRSRSSLASQCHHRTGSAAKAAAANDAQCQEAAVLVAWARENGSRKVGVGGVSLGGLVTQQIVGHCGGWPEAMRPDMAFVGAGSGHVDQVVALGHLSKLLGLTDAVRQAGWTDQLLAELRPLLDPPDTESIDPEAIVACLGTRDSSTPFRLASDLLDRWRVPDENRIIRDEDHMALYTFLIRKPDVADRIAASLLSDAV